MKTSSRRQWSLFLSPLLLVTLVTAAAAQKPVPTWPDEMAAAMGKQIFQTYCASCHGESAVGDGDVAEYLKVKPANLTQIQKIRGGAFPFTTVVDMIDGRVKVKGHGQGEMPIWGDAFRRAEGGRTAEEVAAKIDHLAHYLWSIQKY